MSKFKINEYADFSDEGTFFTSAKFKHQDPNGDYWAEMDDGYLHFFNHARKIEPRVHICFCEEETHTTVSKELADRIKAGEF